jgi:hypothetical protein
MGIIAVKLFMSGPDLFADCCRTEISGLISRTYTRSFSVCAAPGNHIHVVERLIGFEHKPVGPALTLEVSRRLARMINLDSSKVILLSLIKSRLR